MLLTIDIGNTNVTIGVFERDASGAYPYAPKATWRVSTDHDRMPDEYGVTLMSLLPLKGIDPQGIGAAALCSVVPPLTSRFVEMCRTYFKVEPLIVSAGVKTGIKVLYDTPRDVGADRIADAAAAIRLYGGPCIVVDCGTTTVFNAITKQAEYLGGAIAPGLAMSAETLFHRTSQLRRVELERPPAAIGKNTVHAIQSGLVLGTAELIKGMVARFDKELGGGCKVIATGGLSALLARESGVFHDVNIDLTLAGLRIIHELNS
ncbi:MAG: type III pantothenate kinase [SAR202 cluster bacterium]|nr:type III pantothenate kinase [SAR202 cluster bacterium]